MSSPPESMSPKRKHFELTIEGWLDDQFEHGGGPSFIPQSQIQYAIDDDDMASKRQKTADMESRQTSFMGEASSSPMSFTEATPNVNSIKVRRIQLKDSIPAILFGPPEDVVELDRLPDAINSLSGIAVTGTPTVATASSLESPPPPSEPNVKDEIPLKICDLIRRLSEQAADQILPADIVSIIQKISPTECFPKPKANNAPQSTIQSRKLLEHIWAIFCMASDLHNMPQDEAAWYPLIRMVLLDPPGTSPKPKPFVMAADAQNKVLCSELLPKLAGKPIPAVKIDYLLQFNVNHPEIGSLYQPAFQKQPLFSLSAFNHSMASRTFTCALVEVKPPHGNFQEASYQIGVASAAVLARMNQLDGGSAQAGDIVDSMPVVGLIVHGHFWTLQVSYEEHDGSIRVLGPYPAGNTATIQGVYRLLRIVEEIKAWGKDEYFPYLSAKLWKWC